MDIINNSYSIVYKNKYDENKVLNMKGSQLLINYMVENNPTIKLSANPWRIINTYNSTFFDELDIARVNAHSGCGIKLVRFLSSDPKVIMNKLKIFLAEN